MYLLVIIFVGLIIAGLAMVLGPTGKQKEALSEIKPMGKRKLEKKEVFQELEEAIVRAKPKKKTWKDLQDDDLKSIVTKAHRIMVDKGYGDDIKRSDVKSLTNEIWRQKRTEAQELPSDDPVERWKKLVGNKFETIRRIDARDETGFLNCPQVEIYEDASKSVSSGQMNHEEWVVILEEQGGVAKVKRRRDKKIGWIEMKYIRRIYTEEDIARGPDKRKARERDE
jgi:hypothetical protein